MSPLPRAIVLLLAISLAGGMLAFGDAPTHQARADEPNVNGAIAEQQRLERELAQQQAHLTALRAQQASLTASLGRLAGDLERVGAELGAARQQLEQLTASLDATRTALTDYRERIANHEEDLARVAVEIEDAKVDLAERESLLQDHLRVAYEQSRVSILEVLLSADSFGDASSRLGYLLTLSDEDLVLADEIRESRRQLEVKRETLRSGREKLVALEAEAAVREAQLAEQQAQADAARALLESKQAELEAIKVRQEEELHATEANAAAQEVHIAAHERALQGQRALVEQLKAEALKLDIAFHGRFAWPYRGSDWLVTQEFGNTSFNHAHTGMDLAYRNPQCGGPVYAAADGRVLADGRPNAAHGDDAVGVIIGHSQRLQGWYWHLSSELVSVGQDVRAGDLIGYEGATGLATGCHLHFQVMFDGEPVNPREYLP